MQTRQTNRVNMIRTTLNYCTDNPAPTAGIPSFATVKATAANKLILIDQFDQIITRSVKNVTLDTKLIRTAMSNIALKCGNGVSAYAASVNNNILRGKVTFTMPQLNRFKKDVVDDICQQIHDEADANIATAGSFGYDATDVTDLATAINLYRTSMQNPRAFTISKKQAVENSALLIDEIISNLFKKQMDKMVSTLQTISPEFVQGYFFSREIINLGSTTAKVRGTIKNPEEIPLVGVTFTIRKTGQLNKVGETLSITGGKFGIADLLPDNYDLYWQFPGYQAITETNVHISAGKEIRRNITMQPVTGQTITLQGFVRNEEDNSIIVGAVINVGGHTTVSQNDGSYFLQFTPAASPNYVVNITATGFQAINTTKTILTGQTNTEDIEMIPAEVGSLSGTASDIVTALGIGGAAINITAPGINIMVIADANGNYNKGGIPVGTYTVTASAPDYIGQSLSVTINANTNTIQNFNLTPQP